MGCEVWGLGFGVWVVGFGVWGLMFGLGGKGLKRGYRGGGGTGPSGERCPPKPMSRVEHLKAKVEPLLAEVTVEIWKGFRRTYKPKKETRLHLCVGFGVWRLPEHSWRREDLAYS